MLITIGGIDGSGKTTQVKMLESGLQEHGFDPLTVKAFDDATKRACRPFVESWEDDAAILFLFHALYAQQRATTTKALADGRTVITDRWDETYLAHYENFGVLSRRPDLRLPLFSLVFEGVLPDIGFILKIPVEVARQRRELREEKSRFGEGADDHYEILQRSYCTLANTRKWHILDGTQDAGAIHRQIMSLVLKL
ncbi:thymidylate kinase [Candidatus Parcubacteria bacterium]|nr:MAG: thymidylate kinase [Candidatus Parcubacteria bacterium]